MTNEAPSRDPSAPAAAVPAAPRAASTRPSGPPPRSGGGALALAVLLALVAVGGSAYVGWQQWQQERRAAAVDTTTQQLQDRVAALQASTQAMEQDRRALRERLQDADDVNRGLREEVLGQNERLRNLEDAVAKLSEKSLSGHDAMLLDEAEGLLRMGKSRYDLFHDAAGAAAAYALADQALAGVDDGAFSGLRQSVSAEQEALAAAANAHDDAALATLAQLRGQVATLPLKPLDTPAAASAGDAGVWSRIGQALASVVRIEREDGTPMAVADAGLARELLSLDLAQAEAALLAHDAAGSGAALQRALGTLSAQFDGGDAAVRQAHDTLAALANRPAAKAVTLGAALAELRNLRAVHALKPAAAEPAPARSSGARP